MNGQLQCFNDGRIIFSGLCADHPRCGGIRVLVTLYAAQFIHQVFWNHQEVCDALQPAGKLVGIQLIDRIEGLKLDSRTPVKLRKDDSVMHSRNHSFRPAVTVGIAGQDFLIFLHQHIIYCPGINRQAFDLRIFLLCFIDACFYVLFQCSNIPGQMSVLFRNAVRETINLPGPDFPVFFPANNVPSAGCADINRKIIPHSFPPYPR